ncbi:STAS domain-containing protein [Microbispora sp. NPDC049125]|uniref:STAS domain-containing protein n=1 Tax=Microbispora sp. NPDC049125 TaxID=3154929 RepID=UPI0034657FAF
MPDTPPFQAEPFAPEPGVIRLALKGALDYSTAPDVPAMVPELFADGPHTLELDLSGLEFVDSSGLAALLELHRACAAQGAHLRIVALTPHLSHLLEVTMLDEVFDLPG